MGRQRFNIPGISAYPDLWNQFDREIERVHSRCSSCSEIPDIVNKYRRLVSQRNAAKSKIVVRLP